MPSGFRLALLSGLILLMGAGATLAQGDRALERRGEELLSRNCARCHAIGRSGESTHPQAPSFRTLGLRYPIENLAEGLAEGFSSGHPDMPEFRFEVDEVDAILAYLESIQEKGRNAQPSAR
jgi:mono/diheme cytochrome c family protein